MNHPGSLGFLNEKLEEEGVLNFLIEGTLGNLIIMTEFKDSFASLSIAYENIPCGVFLEWEELK